MRNHNSVQRTTHATYAALSSIKTDERIYSHIFIPIFIQICLLWDLRLECVLLCCSFSTGILLDLLLILLILGFTAHKNSSFSQALSKDSTTSYLLTGSIQPRPTKFYSENTLSLVYFTRVCNQLSYYPLAKTSMCDMVILSNTVARKISTKFYRLSCYLSCFIQQKTILETIHHAHIQLGVWPLTCYTLLSVCNAMLN